ncbi:MAG: tyrosine-type recombinase/integrase [Actinomycetota bacterium]
MTKVKTNPLPTLVQNFFAQNLRAERDLSPCTVASYRDTFRLLFNYLQVRTQRHASEQRLEDWDAPHILGFLEHLEKQRGCCPRTRNARLAAIHCFMRYVSQHEPTFLALAGRVLAIPNKRQTQPLLGYLTVEQVQAVLEAPAAATFSGRRDRLLFQLLYNTGARVSEIVALNRQDLQPGTCQTITLHGKGRKERIVPLWPKTARQMRQWLDERPAEPATPVFVNRFGIRLSRFGIEKQLTQAARKAAQVCPSLRGRQVSPHIFRHTTAMHLLQSDVDITAIALWLGHESPLTTHKYIEADLEMKKKTLSRLKEPKGKMATFKPRDALLAFLEAI